MPLFALFELFLDDGAKEHDEPDAEKRAKDAEEEIQPISLARGIGKDEDDCRKEGGDGEDDEKDFERPEGAQLLARFLRFRGFLIVSRDGRLVLFGVDARTLHERVEVFLRVAFQGAFQVLFVIFEGFEIGKLIHIFHPLNKFCLYFTLSDGFRQEV